MTKEEVLFSHSNNIYSEFNESCIKYLYQGTPVNTKRNIQPIVNLLPTKTNNDRIIEWNTNAQRLSMSISNMSNLLQREFDEYNRLLSSSSSSTCDTNNIIMDSMALRRKQVDAQNNINDLERTVVSFIARTANQIEELRRNLKVGIILMGGDVEHHRTGVVSILVHRLRQEIVSEMSEIRKIRMNDLAKVKEEEEHKQRIEDDDDHDDEPYEEEDDHTTSNQLYHRMHSSGGTISSIKKVEQQQPTYQPMEEEEYSSTHPQHYQELQTIHQQSNALTEVNQMEQTMMQVSSLLNQFSILVEEQQNDIVNVNDKAKVSKGNVEDGTDLLMDAKDRMKNSGNYMAKSIILLSFTLLFMNWIFP